VFGPVWGSPKKAAVLVLTPSMCCGVNLTFETVTFGGLGAGKWLIV